MSKHIAKTPEELAALAAKDGCEVVWGHSTRLLLDLDDRGALTRYEALFPLLEKTGFRSVKEERWPSKSGGEHLHVVVYLAEPLPVEARIALQAILGSDPKHELLTLLDTCGGKREPVLFRPLAKPAVPVAPKEEVVF